MYIMQASGNESVTCVHYFIWPVVLHNFIDHFSHCAQPHSFICMYNACEISQTWNISQKIQPSLLSLNCLGHFVGEIPDICNISMTEIPYLWHNYSDNHRVPNVKFFWVYVYFWSIVVMFWVILQRAAAKLNYFFFWRILFYSMNTQVTVLQKIFFI